MIEELRLRNWKSFGDSTLFIEPLTFIIGFNASGKSNILDALSFLSSISNGMTIDDAARNIRGGLEWLLRNGTDTAGLQVKVRDDKRGIDYCYEIVIGRLGSKFEVLEERLTKITNDSSITLVETDERAAVIPVHPLRLFTGKSGRRQSTDVFRDRMALFQLASNVKNEVREGVLCVLERLQYIFVLNPIPPLMRNYVPIQKELKGDASNIAGVIAGIDDNERVLLQNRIASFVSRLPERDIVEIWTEKVGMFAKDAMLYCKEKWTDNSEMVLDARGMSDGTLRFIAIVTALLTLPPGTLLLIEEIDNGLHPSRAKELISALKTIGEERSIDVLCTTHNPYLIDALGTELISSISYVKRDESDGNSVICLLEEDKNLFNLMAGGSIGMSMAKGKI